MGYDLQIWSVRPFAPAFLKQSDKWRRSGDGYRSLPHAGWQIVINPSDKVLPEDVPAEVAALLPGIAYLTELNLEGDAPTKAMQLLRVTAKDIAKGAHGIVEDPQEDTITTPAGVKRFVPPKTEKKFSVIGLSWWFLTDVLGSSAGRDRFLSLLEKRLPEALPKRYGLYEPPQHKFAETGKAHLRDFMGKNLDNLMVWYPHRPVTKVQVACPKRPGASGLGFRSNLFEIEIESAVLKQPGWKAALELLWHEMTHLLRPIYGETRTIGGRVRMGATVGIEAADLEQDYPSTTRSWFWRGVPRTLGHAVVLGPEYQHAWPEFIAQAQVENGFAFASTWDWSSDVDLLQQIGGVPEGIALLPGEGMGRAQKYPPVWPFGPVFDPMNH